MGVPFPDPNASVPRVGVSSECSSVLGVAVEGRRRPFGSRAWAAGGGDGQVAIGVLVAEQDAPGFEAVVFLAADGFDVVASRGGEQDPSGHGVEQVTQPASGGVAGDHLRTPVRATSKGEPGAA